MRERSVNAKIIMHKSCKGPEKLINKLERIIHEGDNRNPSIVVGPDYSLNNSIEKPNSEEEWKDILNKLKKLCENYEHLLLIPGTALVKENNLAKVLCPIFYGGKLYKILEKETDRGESFIADKFGLSYHRGNNNNNNIKEIFGLENISIQICSDHGKQVIPNNTKLEIILAHDPYAGYYMGAANFIKNKRFAIVCDGYNPKIEVFKIKGKIKLVKPIKEVKGVGEIYNLQF